MTTPDANDTISLCGAHEHNQCNPTCSVLCLQWSDRAQQRADSMHSLMWSAQTGRWHDLYVPDLELGTGMKGSIAESRCRCTPVAEQISTTTAVSWLPFLWGVPGACREDGVPDGRCRMDASAIVARMQRSRLIGANGLLNTTTVQSGEQWDAPNCWPPLLCMWVDGLLAHGGSDGAALARKLAPAYLRAVSRGLELHGVVFEKYATEGEGASGGGGEYEPQVGFGWSNGVALHLIGTLQTTL